MNHGVNSLGGFAPKSEWLASFFELKKRFFVENLLGMQEYRFFLRFLRDAGTALPDRRSSAFCRWPP